MKQPTQYEQLVAVVPSGTTVNLVSDATMGSRHAFEVIVPGFGTLFLSADKRITKVVPADGAVTIKPNAEQRAEIFAAIQRAAITARHREEMANGTRVLDMSVAEAVTGERFPATV